MSKQVTKRKVTMRSTSVVGYDKKGRALLQDHEAVDYVLPEHLDAYVAEARLRWQAVDVSEDPDAGPAGYDGETTIHPHMEG